MNFFAKAIHTLDPENQESLEREVPDTFESFVDELFDYINTNKSVRYFKIRSLNTEVVSAIFEIINSENNTLFNKKSKIIVNRLLRIEKETQEEIKRLGIKVRKGSVIQSIAHGENNDIIYLLAKVQHSDFVDDNDLLFRTGFPKGQKGIWKSCLFFISKDDKQVHKIMVYSDNSANYWKEKFLELDPIHSDEENTQTSFLEIEKVINRVLKEDKHAKRALRSNFISYIKNNKYIDYDKMVETCTETIDKDNVGESAIKKLKDDLLNLPERKNFDRQFESSPKSITARIRRTFPISQGIDLHVNNVEGNLYDKIVSLTEKDGKRYLKISVEDSKTYEEFSSN